MIIENLSTLKIHKMTQEQYEREFAAGNLDSNALYLTPNNLNVEKFTISEDLNHVLMTETGHGLLSVTDGQTLFALFHVAFDSKGYSINGVYHTIFEISNVFTTNSGTDDVYEKIMIESEVNDGQLLIWSKNNLQTPRPYSCTFLRF